MNESNPRPKWKPKDFEKEIVDRLRRIETRFTKYLESRGFDTGVKRPVFRDGEVIIPSLSCSLRDILSAVPDGHLGEIQVIFDDIEVCAVEVIAGLEPFTTNSSDGT